MNKFTPNDLPKAQHVQICIYVVGESHKYSGNFIEDLPGENVEVYRTPGIEQSLNLIKIKNKNIQKILDNLKTIEHLIDCSIFEKGRSGDLSVYTRIPVLVHFDPKFESTIKNV